MFFREFPVYPDESAPDIAKNGIEPIPHEGIPQQH